MSFAKLDSGIVDSTLWMQPHDVLRVWIAMLAKANASGYVRASVPSMAHLCMVPIERLEQVLLILTSPDPYSRTPEDDGRRLRAAEGGWQIVNYLAYRNARDADAERARKREWDRLNRFSGHARAKKSDTSPTQSDAVRQNPTGPTQAEAEAEAKELEASPLEQPAAARSRFADFWAVYPKKVGKKPAEAKWKAKRLDGIAERLIEDVRKRQAEDGRWLDGFVPDPKTYLTQERWEDELQPRRDAPHAAATFKADSGPSPARESESPLERAIAWAQQQFRYGQIDATERDRLIGVATEKHRERAPA